MVANSHAETIFICHIVICIFRFVTITISKFLFISCFWLLFTMEEYTFSRERNSQKNTIMTKKKKKKTLLYWHKYFFRQNCSLNLRFQLKVEFHSKSRIFAKYNKCTVLPSLCNFWFTFSVTRTSYGFSHLQDFLFKTDKEMYIRHTLVNEKITFSYHITHWPFYYGIQFPVLNGLNLLNIFRRIWGRPSIILWKYKEKPHLH